MGKKSRKKKKDSHDTTVKSEQPRGPVQNAQPKLGGKQYGTELFKLQVELVKLQEGVKKTGAQQKHQVTAQRW